MPTMLMVCWAQAYARARRSSDEDPLSSTQANRPMSAWSNGASSAVKKPPPAPPDDAQSSSMAKLSVAEKPRGAESDSWRSTPRGAAQSSARGSQQQSRDGRSGQNSSQQAPRDNGWDSRPRDRGGWDSGRGGGGGGGSSSRPQSAARTEAPASFGWDSRPRGGRDGGGWGSSDRGGGGGGGRMPPRGEWESPRGGGGGKPREQGGWEVAGGSGRSKPPGREPQDAVPPPRDARAAQKAPTYDVAAAAAAVDRLTAKRNQERNSGAPDDEVLDQRQGFGKIEGKPPRDDRPRDIRASAAQYLFFGDSFVRLFGLVKHREVRLQAFKGASAKGLTRETNENREQIEKVMAVHPAAQMAVFVFGNVDVHLSWFWCKYYKARRATRPPLVSHALTPASLGPDSPSLPCPLRAGRGDGLRRHRQGVRRLRGLAARRDAPPHHRRLPEPCRGRVVERLARRMCAPRAAAPAPAPRRAAPRRPRHNGPA